MSRVFQQRVKERLGAQWAHVTSQPEVDEAIKQVQDMWDYFMKLEKMVDKERLALQKLSDVETEMSLWYQQQGYQESEESIRKSMAELGQAYNESCQQRLPLVRAYEHYLEFLKTFREKAIGDSLETMKRQQQARVELDAYGSKLGQLEEKKLKAFAKSPGVFNATHDTNSPLEREVAVNRQRFTEAKNRYQSLSTQLIDKAGLLDMKKGVDFAAHLKKIVEIHEVYTGKRTVEPIPDEE